MRECEILNLRWNRVDRKTGFIKLKPVDTKTSEGRKVPIDPKLEEAMSALPRSMQKDGSVFTRDDQPIKSVRHRHEKTCKDSEIENFWFHDLRHICTTNRRRQEIDYLTIMKATGHKNPAMFQRYNTVNEGDLKTLVNGQNKNNSQNRVNKCNYDVKPK